jgi:arabinogalactan endo-1,4-beta-galactosidase
VTALVAAGARPDMVQIGNSITPGFELSPGTPLGPASSWPALGALLQAGIAGVRAVDPTIPIMLHVDRCADASASIAWIEDAQANGVTFDVFGESCYVAFQGGPTACGPVLTSLATQFPTLQFAIAEYNSDTTNQCDNELTQANTIVFGLNTLRAGAGIGAFSWEPTRDINAQNLGMFTVKGNVYTPITACITQYDAMKTTFGL